jgi:hypothetical protein
MGLIDHDEIERLAACEDARDSLCARKLAADEEDACAIEGIGSSATDQGLDTKKREELVLPLADQRLRNDDQQAALPLGSKLRQDKSRLNRLAEPDLISKDAAAFAEAAKSEHDGIDLMRIWVDPALALRRSRTGMLVGSATADEIFRCEATLDRMR